MTNSNTTTSNTTTTTAAIANAVARYHRDAGVGTLIQHTETLAKGLLRECDRVSRGVYGSTYYGTTTDGQPWRVYLSRD